VCCLVAGTAALADSAPACFENARVIAAVLDMMPLGWPGRSHPHGWADFWPPVAEGQPRPRLRRLSLAGAKRLGCHVAGGLPAWLPNLEHLDVANMPLLAQAPPDDLRRCLCAPAPAPARAPRVAARRDVNLQCGWPAISAAGPSALHASGAYVRRRVGGRTRAPAASALPARCRTPGPLLQAARAGARSHGDWAAGRLTWALLDMADMRGLAQRPPGQANSLPVRPAGFAPLRPPRRRAPARAAAGGGRRPVPCARRRGWLCQRAGQPCPALRTLRVPPGFLRAADGAPPERGAVRPGLEVEEVAPPPTLPGWVPPRRARR